MNVSMDVIVLPLTATVDLIIRNLSKNNCSKTRSLRQKNGLMQNLWSLKKSNKLKNLRNSRSKWMPKRRKRLN
jgi:hypothetical protein